MDRPEQGDSGGPDKIAAEVVQKREKGSVQAYGKRGVWTPSQMTATEIMHGAAVLERKWKIDHYQARSMVRAVLRAIRLPSQREPL